MIMKTKAILLGTAALMFTSVSYTHLDVYKRQAKYNPLKGPCFLIASTAYCEHVGVKRHEGEVRGEMHF